MISSLKTIVILLSLIFILDTSLGLRNDRAGPSFVRRNRRIALNEYLVPPPLPRPPPPPAPPGRHYAPIRSGRVVNPPRPTEAPGYFSNLMSWFNPFGLGSFSLPDSLTAHALPPPPPPPPPGSYQPSHRPGPPPPGHLDGPLPGNHPGLGYLPANKGKQCNPCNKVPWVPMENGDNPGFHVFPPIAPPLPPEQFPHSIGPVYLPPNENYADAHQAASHEVRATDFSQTVTDLGRPPPVVGPLPDPHLYPGPVPPLYKAEPFVPPEHRPPPASPLPAPDQPQLLHVGPLPVHNGPVPSDPLPVESSPFETNRYAGTPDSGPTATDHREFGHFPNEQDRLPESFGTSVSNDRPPSYPTPDLNRYPGSVNIGNYYDAGDSDRREIDDLSSSSSIVKDSRVTIQNAVNVKSHPIQFEQSPLLDLTKKDGQGRGDWISSTPGPGELLVNGLLEDTATRAATTPSVTAVTGGTVNYDDGENERDRGNTILFGGQSTIPNGDSTESYSDHLRSIVPGANLYYPKNSEENYSTNSRRIQDNVSIAEPHPELLWSKLLPKSGNNGSRYENSDNFRQRVKTESDEITGREDRSGTSQKPQTAKRNKQVQVIIPYTSDYTPVPFQQVPAISDWKSFNESPERTQPRKVAYFDEPHGDNYAGQESRNEARLLDRLGNRPGNFSDGSNVQQEIRATTPLQATIAEAKPRYTLVKVNNSIDVHRLQKNIDNWTIQEYSRAMTSSTVLPSSARPYLLPSKKIPDEYLTTTEPTDRAKDTEERRDTVKSYSLAGFSFNDLEHEPSASDRVEETSQIEVVRVKESNRNGTNRDFIWEGPGVSVSVSSSSKERVYVVTPQPLPSTSPVFASNRERTNESNLEDFEAIERAYQVLPQAVNNLAVASTGKENVPLWGIMEHEEFASLTTEDGSATEERTEEENADISPAGPILYAGHSKVCSPFRSANKLHSRDRTRSCNYAVLRVNDSSEEPRGARNTAANKRRT